MKPSRRTVVAGGGALLASTIVPAHRPRAQAMTGHHTFKLGAAEITVVSDGTMSMPLDWVLPGRPRDEIAAAFTDDGRTLGELSIQVNATVIRTGSALVLIDAGAGPDFAPQRGRLADNLAKAGIKPEEVTTVVFTHAHPDHLWGVIDPLDGGSAFTKARHLISAVERDYWLKPGIETQVPKAVRGGAIGTQRRLKELAPHLDTMAPGAEIALGLSVIDTAGHTPGHVALSFQSGLERLVIGGDALIEPTISFARPAWTWGPDWGGAMAIASRLKLLDMLATEKIPLLGYHLPWPGLGRVERRAGAAPAYRFVQA